MQFQGGLLLNGKYKSAATALPLFLVCLLFASGCGQPKKVYPLPPDGVSRFPTGEALEEGDIILARSYGLIGAMFANHSQEEGGRFSHGAMVYRNDDGRLMMLNYRPTGMETCTPEEFFSRYNRLGLVRYRHSLDEARAPDYVPSARGLTGKDAMSKTSIHWLRKNEATRIPPDYHLDHDDHAAMFCIELTSTVYRDCGLPDPFNKAQKANEDPLLKKANTLFKADVYEIRSPSCVLTNPDYVQISEWLRPEFDLRQEALNEEVIKVLVEDIDRGLLPKRPKMMGRLKLRQVFILYHIITKTMFWKPKQDLPSFIDAEVIDNAYMLYSYAARSKKAAKERMLVETTAVYGSSANQEETLATVRRIVREETDKHRDTYISYEGRGKAAKAKANVKVKAARPGKACPAPKPKPKACPPVAAKPACP